MPSNRIDFALFLGRLLAVLFVIGAAHSANAAPVETTADEEHQRASHFKTQERGAEAWFGGFTRVPWLLGTDSEIGPSEPVEGEAEKPTVSLPVPAAIWMFGTGLAALGLARRRISAWRRRDQRRASISPSLLPARRRLSRHRLRAALRQRIDCSAAGAAGGDAADSTETGQPPRDGGRGPANAPPPQQCPAKLMAQRFAELAAALAEQPDVALGRRFGMSCVKFGKRPFLALDDGERGGLAFRVGGQGAVRLLDDLPQLEYWNPRQERQPKLSWVICRQGHGEVLVRLALEAYEQALRDAPRPAVEPDGYPAAEPEGA